jgi:hypothetical protein
LTSPSPAPFLYRIFLKNWGTAVTSALPQSLRG